MAEATFNFTHKKISVEDLADGRHVVETTPGGAKICHVRVGRQGDPL